ncbi:sulfur carrier protein ThiS [Maricaulis sp.]|uniref:sulfur carrier protein ThiS n=1 Tax=Maricaulis sp. TaxID=1486257 RepID=UPI00344FF831
MQLTVNGEGRKVEPGTSVTGLVTILGLDRRKIAVERNLAIVPRSQYEHTALADGDRIEIVAFVGGG